MNSNSCPAAAIREAATFLALCSVLLLLTSCSRSGSDVTATKFDVPALQTKAIAGDAQAQADLGYLYIRGEGVTNSYLEAARLFRKSASQGNSYGLLGLGELCESGQGVPKDVGLAMKFYQQAAEKGNARAQYTMAFAYESGRGVSQDQAEAAKWFRKAADQGDALSQYALGQRYDIGVGVPPDKIEALKWLTLAANQGQADAKARRDKVKAAMTRDQIAEADQRVAAFAAEE